MTVASSIPSGLFIDGAFVEPAGAERFPVIDPATEEQIGSAVQARPEDVDAAVAAARRAFDQGPWWRSWSAGERSRLLWRIGERIIPCRRDRRARDAQQRQAAARNGVRGAPRWSVHAVLRRYGRQARGKHDPRRWAIPQLHAARAVRCRGGDYPLERGLLLRRGQGVHATSVR